MTGAQAKIGDRVRSNKFPGVSGIVERVEVDATRTIYYTSRGFWYDHEVTVERCAPQPESQPGGAL